MLLISTLVFCVLCLFLWKELKPYMDRLLPPSVPHVSKEGEEEKERTAIPTTLWLMAMSESDEWARESQLKAMHQMYTDADNNWSTVAHLLSAESEKE